MKKIYKYEIKPNSVYNSHHPIVIDAPQGAKPIHIEGDFLWAEVETDNENAFQEVLVCVGTGHGVVPKGYTHFQSIIQIKKYTEETVQYVWHFYKKDESELEALSLLNSKYIGQLR